MILKRGELPATPHTEYYVKPDVLALEEIHGSYGFSGPWSRKLHVRSYPTEQVQAPQKASFDFIPQQPAEADTLQPYLVQTADMPTGGDALRSRKCIVFGSRTKVSFLKPDASFPSNEFFRNGEAYEAYYVLEGEGALSSEFGEIPFRKESYIVVPKGTTYRIDLTSETAHLMLIESLHPIDWPPHYVNQSGQAGLHAPVVETEIEGPQLQSPIDERGEFTVFVQHGGGKVTQLTLGHHPFDVAGWEGSLYPFLFDINSHHGIASETHTAPPMHQTFQSGNVPHDGFSLCSFVPQMEGWHPKDVPAPYAHLNADSDEVMLFCNASYGARKGFVRNGSFTFHPGSLPHSPQGKAALRSLAKRGKMNKRLAVMLDTYFEPLNITDIGYQFRDPDYPLSWNEALKKDDIGSA